LKRPREELLTGIAAILLATSVGAVGAYLRSDNVGSTKTVANSVLLDGPSLSAPTGALLPGPSLANNPSLVPNQSPNLASGPAGGNLVSALADVSEPLDNGLVFFSVEPASRTVTTPDVQLETFARIPADFCNIDLRAAPKSSARVQLRIFARCHPNTAVTISYSGLQFRERLGDYGELQLTIPAFSKYSLFNIELSDGLKASVGALVTGLSRIERVGISWEGENTTFLHAYEPGFGRPSHIWSLEPRSYRESLLDGGGYLEVLGNPDMPHAAFAQIYSRPVQVSRKNQLVSLSVETLVDTANCDKSFALKTARHTIVGGYSGTSAVLKLPECGSGSDSLVSKNLVKDIRIAGN